MLAVLEFNCSVQKRKNMQSCCWIKSEIFESLDHTVMLYFLATVFGPVFGPVCLFAEWCKKSCSLL